MKAVLRVLVILVVALGASMCRQPQQRSSSGLGSPIGPSPVAAPTSADASRAVTFPPRNEPFDFRANALEAKYRDQLRRGAVSTFVDVEGTIVWTQEYLLYRVSGCGHEDGIQRVLRQIDGAPFQGACASGTFPFPPRNEPFDFRGRLEAKYRDGLRRSTVQTFVDVEGDIVWTQEYLRYRVSGCAHALATQKVMDQIDGRGVQSDCAAAPPLPPSGCNYSVSPTSQTVVAGGEARTAAVTTTAGCTWTVTSDVTWLTIQSGSSNSGTGTIRYTAAANPGAERIGNIQVRWPTVTAGQNIRVTQAGGIGTAPQARITVTTSTPCRVERPCDMNGTASTGTGLVYRWNFGDGVTGSGLAVTHAYPTNFVTSVNSTRIATVTLTVEDSLGRTSVATAEVSVFRAY